jgi:hypothetical protein
VKDDTDAITDSYEKLQNVRPGDQKTRDEELPRLSPALIGEVKAVVAAQDAQGRWIENGRLRYHGAQDSTTRVIRSATFIRNVETLSRYLTAARSTPVRN